MKPPATEVSCREPHSGQNILSAGINSPQAPQFNKSPPWDEVMLPFLKDCDKMPPLNTKNGCEGGIGTCGSIS